MDSARLAAILKSVMEAGLAGMSEPNLLVDFCGRLAAGGLPVARANIVVDTLHPVHEGRVFRWRRDQKELEPVLEYGRTSEGGEAEASWRRSPFYHLVQTGEAMLRRRLADGASYSDHQPVSKSSSRASSVLTQASNSAAARGLPLHRA